MSYFPESFLNTLIYVALILISISVVALLWMFYKEMKNKNLW